MNTKICIFIQTLDEQRVGEQSVTGERRVVQVLEQTQPPMNPAPEHDNILTIYIYTKFLTPKGN